MSDSNYKPDQITRDIEHGALRQAFTARLDALGLSGERLIQDYQMKCATTLLSAGIDLIPSDNLRDHQFVVSRGVYEAAKKLIKGEGP